ncbi:hypothetical protein H4219_006081 [Mycoemilia scoparia]|uniref:Uncharacterized protein n=1 Tax=Mycoemilia scoparia TaxID=417184 RepID=A0A9W8DNN5_9FUNG|nr:hypothetical protein H4219_006081 [Mycoemilia scoparia]
MPIRFGARSEHTWDVNAAKQEREMMQCNASACKCVKELMPQVKPQHPQSKLHERNTAADGVITSQSADHSVGAKMGPVSSLSRSTPSMSDITACKQ